MAAIQHLLTIRASAEKVYEAITTEQGLQDWWTIQTVAKPEVGFENEFRFGDVYYNKMRVTKLNPNNIVEWECTDGDKEWIGTQLSYNIEDKGEECILRFSHADWREVTDFYASCNYHWGYYLRSLKLLCEEGAGYPFKP